MAQDSHPQFSVEQDLLKKVWRHCKRLYDDLLASIEEKGNKLIRAREYSKEGYGEFQILSRQIRDTNEEEETLKQALEEPYFGKIEYIEKGQKNTVYISRVYYNCPDATVVSWHAPIANLFYSREATGNGIDLRLIQRLEVNKDVLVDIYDIYTDSRYTESDPFLLKQLRRFGIERLRDIVLTIQEEQNRIIRAPLDQHIVVQGGAGTGKTIVLVYRVAYLLHNASHWKKSDVLFLSPSKAFLGYILSLLPDTDIANIAVLSLGDLMPQFGKSIIKGMKKFPEIMEINKAERWIAAGAAGFKGTLAFKKLLDSKVEKIANEFASKIKSFNYKVLDKQESIPGSVIRKWFIEELASFPLERRARIIRQRIKDRVSNILEPLADNRLAGMVFSQQQIESMLAAYFKEWPDFKRSFQTELIPWYFNILNGYDEVAAALDDAQTVLSKNVLCWSKYFAMLTQNDWAAIFYLYQRIADQTSDKYKLIVIDEAHMLSPLWLAGLKYMLADDGVFLLAGDINQKPAVVNLSDWNAFEDVVGKLEVMELSNCYRMTDEIANFALSVLRKHRSLYQFKTVGRKGEDVITLEGTASHRLMRLKEEIKVMLEKYRTIAIVGRTTADCERLYDYLGNYISEIVLVADDTGFGGRVVIIPVHLAGGLEFDAVVIMDHKQYDIEDIFEAQQLYLGVTRAVHKLILA